ncbi:MAG: flagellar biosynthetic protein FliR [bacterium]|nr:flagellar biosynthetic protein FliR [bacterium]
MPDSLGFSAPALIGFLLVLTRVSGAMAFVPIPGFKNMPVKLRVILSLGITMALSGSWPSVEGAGTGVGILAVWVLAEAAFGITVGLGVAFLQEAFVLASQIFGLQAGYGYASTVDPATQADSSVLQIFTHLAAGMLFFAFGLDRQVIRIFATSLEAHPPGTYALSLAAAEPMLRLGGSMFATAVRLALPVVALLLLVDVSLALMGRINAQLQLLMLAFPVKMLVSMALLAVISVVLPSVYRSMAEPTIRTLTAVLNPAG